MDGERFDGLARAFAPRSSRRSVLGTVAGLAAAAIGSRLETARGAGRPADPATCKGVPCKACANGPFRKGALLKNCDLTGRDLAGQTLTGANLTGACLSAADLTGANLAGAILTNACLDNTNLTNTNLKGALMKGAVVDGASVCGADLRGTNLNQTTQLTKLTGICCSTKLPTGKNATTCGAGKTCCPVTSTRPVPGCCPADRPICCAARQGCTSAEFPQCCQGTDSACAAGAHCCTASQGSGCCPADAPTCCTWTTGKGKVRKFCCPTGYLCGGDGTCQPVAGRDGAAVPGVERAAEGVTA